MLDKQNDYGERYSKVYDLLTSHKNYEEEVNSLLSFLDPYLREKKIVSVGCGTGKHEIIISSRGFKVFGIDNSFDMLKEANFKKINGICEFGSNFNQALKFFGDEKFGCAISLFNCVNCLENEKSLKEFISEIYYNLDKKSCFFFEAWNGEECLVNPPKIVSRDYKSDDFNITRLATPKIFFEKKELEIQYSISGHVQGSKLNFISKHKIKLFTPEIILNILKNVGFLNIKIFSALPELISLDEKKLKGNRMLAFYATR